MEMRLSPKNGEYRWHLSQYNPLKDEAGKSSLVRYCDDIDDRKRAEQDLRTITDAIRQSIVVLAPDGTTLYANRVALDNTGLTRAR